jgi:anti-sigma regulatory factor (Ser/Thr protein kinase)
VRGVGEPVWAGRGAAELAECQLHEALMNVAVDTATALWLICPYDVETLDDAVVAEALRSHSAVTEPNGSGGSRFYGGARHAAALFAADLPEPVSPVSTIRFNSRHNSASAGRILRYARAAGLPAQRSAKLAAAVDEVALSGLGHDGGVRIRLWQQDGAVVCEVGDRGTIDDPLVGRSATFGPQHRDRGIRLANELCDLVQVRSNRSGTAVRMHSRI